MRVRQHRREQAAGVTRPPRPGRRSPPGRAQFANLPLEGYFAPRSFAVRHRSALLAFRSALVRAQADAVEPAPLESAFMHSAGMSKQTASLITVGISPTSLKVASLPRVADLMSFYGALAHPLNVSQMLFR